MCKTGIFEIRICKWKIDNYIRDLLKKIPKMAARNFIFLIVLFLFTSCDCPVHHYGRVFSEATGKPIENASIIFDNRTFKTDENGFFEINYITGFCPDETYFISADQYKTQELNVERSSISTQYTVFERNESTNVGYSNTGSKSFSVKNDTLIFYLEQL